MASIGCQKYPEVVSNEVCNKAVCQVKDDGFELSAVLFSMVTGIDNSNRYRQISNTSGTKSKNLKVSRFIMQLSLPNALKPGVGSKMKM